MDNAETEQKIEKKIDYLEIISILWSKRKFIILVTFIGIVLFIGISFLFTPTYLSSASILPEVDNIKYGALADLASLAGVDVGGQTLMLKLYPDIMTSEVILREVIEKKYSSQYYNKPVNLYEYFEIDEETPRRTFEVTLKNIRNKLKVNLNIKNGLITYSIETKDPIVTADILNTITEQLNQFLLTKKNTNASEQRKFIEKRLADVKKDLEKAENMVKEFKEKNRRVSDSPQLILEQERLVREVNLQTVLFTTLKQQYELAKIDEVKNIPVINVLDEAKPAAKKNSPRRSIYAIGGMIIGLIASIAYVIIDNNYRNSTQQVLEIFKKKNKQ
jgi:uncharacterized protein involved in exopolysaccharide biosynthesis